MGVTGVPISKAALMPQIPGALLSIRDILVPELETPDFINYCLRRPKVNSQVGTFPHNFAKSSNKAENFTKDARFEQADKWCCHKSKPAQ